MKAVSEILGCSKQAASHYRRRRQTENHRAQAQRAFSEALPAIGEIRKENPCMGCRTMYDLLHPKGIGRDVFEELGFAHGLRIPRKRSVIRTTYSDKSVARINIIAGLEVTGVNQVWQADITYVFHRGTVWYLSVIIDIYSRRIVGHSLARTMHAAHTVQALSEALVSRGITHRSYLMINTDPGTQYTAHSFFDLVTEYRMYHSYASNALENAYVERVHGTLKNQYFDAIDASTDAEFVAGVARAIKAYNTQRPHSSLQGKRSPAEFEAWVTTIPKEERPIVRIYDYEAEQEKAAETNEEKTASRVKKCKPQDSDVDAHTVISTQPFDLDEDRNMDAKMTTGLH